MWCRRGTPVSHLLISILFSFDNDILDLMEELDFDLMFKEISGSICDPEKFTAYMTERTAILVERFLVSTLCYVSVY